METVKTVNEEINLTKPLNRAVILLVLVITVIVALGSYGYFFYYLPFLCYQNASEMFISGQKAAAQDAFLAFSERYPNYSKLPYVYNRLFFLNFENAKEAEKAHMYLDILKKHYPDSPATVEVVVKWTEIETEKLRPAYENYYNTGKDKGKFYNQAMLLLKDLKKFEHAESYSIAGGKKAEVKLREMVNPTAGGFEFQLFLLPANKPLTSANKLEIAVKDEKGYPVQFEYNPADATVRGRNLARGKYIFTATFNRYAGKNARFEGGEEIYIIPGRQYRDITYLEEQDGFPGYLNSRYLPVSNYPRTIKARPIKLQGSLQPQDALPAKIKPAAYIKTASRADVDQDGIKENISFIEGENSRVVIYHWNGKSYVEQAQLTYKLPQFLRSEIKTYTVKGLAYPVVGIQSIQGGSDVFSEMILLTWNGKDGYRVIWDAFAGVGGDWQVRGNTITMSQDNNVPGLNANVGPKLFQEYEFDGKKYNLVNVYTS